MSVSYFKQGCNYNIKGKLLINKWIAETAQNESKVRGNISVIFCSDEELLSVNRQFLNHDYYTDIITFDYSENRAISGDLFISVDTVTANAEKFNTTPQKEMLRVIIHGVLHLCGYKDKTPKDEAQMREKENFYLAKFAESQLR